MPRLTRTLVQELTAPARGEISVKGDLVAGFALRILASGQKSYYVRYRVGGGRRGQQRRYTIGAVDKMTPEEARRRAKEVLRSAQCGEDPAGAKEARRKALTVRELVDDWLDGPGKRNRKGEVRKAASFDCDKGRLNNHVKPLIGQIKLIDLTRRDVERLRDAIAGGKTASTKSTKLRGVSRVRGGEGAATRTLRILSVVLSWAVEQGAIGSNPVTGVRKAPDRKSERFLSVEELSRLGQVLNRLCGEYPTATRIIRLLILTGCRRREIEALTWTEVDLVRGFLRLRESKTGAKNVFLPADAVQLLRSCPWTWCSWPAVAEPLATRAFSGRRSERAAQRWSSAIFGRVGLLISTLTKDRR